MHVKLQPATVEDAESIAALRNAISDDLTFKCGRGPWTVHTTTAVVLADLREARLLVALHRGEAIATLKLASRKPWSIDVVGFSKVSRPVFLSAMAVAPDLQRQGVGRACFDQALAFARKEKGEAIFLDVFDHPVAGAGQFYLKCGCHETGRAKDRGTARIYYEILLKGKRRVSPKSK